MAAKKPNNGAALSQKFPTSIYIGLEPRVMLEAHVIEISNSVRRQVKASTFLQFLIENYGDAARKAIIKSTLEDQQ